MAKKRIDFKTLFEQDLPQRIDKLSGSVNTLSKEYDKLFKKVKTQKVDLVSKDEIEKLKTLNITQKENQAVLKQSATTLTAVQREQAKLNKARADATALNKAQKGSVIALKAELKALTVEFNSLGNSTERDRKRKKQLQEQILKLDRQIKLVSKSTRANIREVKAAAGSYDALTKRNRELQRELKSLPQGFDKNNKRIRALRTEIQKTQARLKRFDADIGNFQRNVGNYATAWRGVGNVLAAGGIVVGLTGVILLMRNATEIIAEFDERVADIQKTTGLAAEDARELAMSLFLIDTRTAIDDLQGLATAAGRLGIAEKDVIGFVKAVDKSFVALSDALEGTAQDIGLTLGKISKNFDLEGEFGVAGGIERVGSVLNELGKTSAAVEGDIVDFLTRLAGVAPLANLSAAQTAALGATFSATGQSMEVAGSVFNRLLPEIGKNVEEFAEVAGMSVDDFTKLLEEDALEAILAVAEGAKSTETGVIGLAQTLDKFGLNGARAAGILGVLAQNTDEVRRNFKNAADQVRENTSVNDEFNIKNNTLRAEQERLTKQWKEFIISLDSGESVIGDTIKTIVGMTGAILDLLTVTRELTKDEEIDKNFNALQKLFQQTADDGRTFNQVIADAFEDFNARMAAIDVDPLQALSANMLEAQAIFTKSLTEQGVSLSVADKAFKIWFDKRMLELEERRRQEELSKKEIIDIKKEETDEIVKLSQEQRIALRKVEILKAEDRIREAKRIIDNDKLTDQERLDALDEFNAASELRLRLQRANALDNDKQSAEERLVVLEQFKNQANALLDQVDDLEIAIKTKKSTQEEGGPSLQERLDSELDIVDKINAEELKRNADAFLNNEIALKDFLHNKEQLIFQANQGLLDAEVSFLERELANFEGTEQEKLAIQNRLAQARLASAENEAMKKQMLAEQVAEAERELLMEAQEFLTELAAGQFEREVENAELRLEQLQAERDHELDLVGSNEEAKASVKKRFAEEEAKARREIAKANRKQAIFEKAVNIGAAIANTARGITAALGQFPPNVPLSIIVGAIGALQVARIAAAPIPQVPGFEKGTLDSPEGYAMVNEREPELVVDPAGKLRVVNKGKEALTYLEKGSKVLPPHMINEDSLADTDLMRNVRKNLQEVINVNVDVNNSHLEQTIKDGLASVKHAVESKPELIVKGHKAGIDYIMKKAALQSNKLNSRYR